MIVLFNQEQKVLENEIMSSIKNGQFRICTRTKLSSTETMNVFKICLGNIPEYIIFDNCRVSVHAGLNSKTLELLPKRKSLNTFFGKEDVYFLRNKAEKIVHSLHLNGKNDMMKAVSIYDYLCKTVRYKITENSQNAWGALVEKTAVCEGISYAFNLLANVSGLPSVIVQGTLNNGPHAWNMIQINNCFYHVDTTSALEDEVEDSNCNYDCIFMQDSDMKGYVWNKSMYPRCTSTQHNYFVCSHSFAKSIKEAEEIIKRQVSAKRIVYFRTDSSLKMTDDTAYEIFKKVLTEQGISVASGSIRMNPKMDVFQIKYHI